MTNIKTLAQSHLVLEPESGHTCTDAQTLARAVLNRDELIEKLLTALGFYGDSNNWKRGTFECYRNGQRI